MNSKLLLDSQPLVILPELAAAVGLNEAIVLQQVHYWCELNAKAKRNYRDGYYWVYNSFTEWQKQFPWWCEKTVKTTFSKLEKRNLLITANYNRLSLDRTKWYRVNHEALDVLTDFPSGKNYPMDQVDITRPIPEISTKDIIINPSITRGSKKPEKEDFDRPFCDGRIDLDAFIEWYCRLFQKERGKPHPKINPNQKNRVVKTLANFLSDPERSDMDTEDLQHMARDFFDKVGSKDWNISHFANAGTLAYVYDYCGDSGVISTEPVDYF